MDAAEIKPKFIPDDKLRARDNSGGLGYEPHTGEWDDGGYIQMGAKSHLSAGGKEGPGASHKTGDEDHDANKKFKRGED